VAEGFVSRDATAERAMQAVSGTETVEKATGAGGPDARLPLATDARPTPSPSPLATKVVEPQPEPSEGAESVAPDEHEVKPPRDETESPPAAELTEPPVPGEEEEAAADSLDEDRETREAARPAAAYPWSALQIGLGTTAIILLIATVWAWRLRR
jgi:hypothetical protein